MSVIKYLHKTINKLQLTLITGANVIIRAGSVSSSPKSGESSSFWARHKRHIQLKFKVMINNIFIVRKYEYN